MSEPRLTPTEAVILELLESSEPSYGLELVKNSGGRLLRGGVYVLLMRLEEKGFVKSEPEAESIRRLYSATAFGKVALKARRMIASPSEETMTDHDRRACAIPGCKYCGGNAEIFRASEAAPEHRKLLDAAMRMRPQWLTKARELGMTMSNHEGYMCYNSCERTEHHFAIMSYDVIIADAQDIDLEESPALDRVHVTAMHGRDSSSPGMARMGTTLDWLYPCGCGRWEMPTDEQTDAMKRKVANIGARDFARQQRRALTKKRPS